MNRKIIYILLVFGVKVLPMVNFRPIDSDVLNVISRIVGTVQGDCPPWFRSMSEGVATLRAELLWSIQSLLAGLIYTPAG